MRRDNPSRFQVKRISSSTTLTEDDCQRWGQFIATASHITVTLPAPTSGLNQWEIQIDNAATGGYVSVACNGGFIDGSSGLALAPGESVALICVESAASTYKWTKQPRIAEATWLEWTPVLSFTGGSPSAIANGAYCLLDNGLVLYTLSLSTSDGDGATDLSVLLPTPVADIDMDVPAQHGQQFIDGTPSACLPYVDQADDTFENRKLKFRGFGTWTSARACSLRVSGFYFVSSASVTSVTPTEAWATGTPASTSPDIRYVILGGHTVFFTFETSSTDSNACTDLTVSGLPVSVPDNNNRIACSGIQAVGNTPTYTNCLAYLEGGDDTEANRSLKFYGFSTGVDAEAIKVSVSGIYELGGWTEYGSALKLIWGTGEPAAPTKVARYRVHGGICLFAVYLTSEDGNGASSLAVSLPVAPRYAAGVRLPVCSVQTQHTDTFDCPEAYIDHGQSTATARLIVFNKFTNADDAESVTVLAAGFFAIDR